eukprot:IDg7331t1
MRVLKEQQRTQKTGLCSSSSTSRKSAVSVHGEATGKPALCNGAEGRHVWNLQLKLIYYVR